MLITQEGSREH